MPEVKLLEFYLVIGDQSEVFETNAHFVREHNVISEIRCYMFSLNEARSNACVW